MFVAGMVLIAVGTARASDAPKDEHPVNPHAGVDPAAGPAADGPNSAGEEELPSVKLTGELDFSVLEMLAIQEGGRKKPLQTYANERVEQLVGLPLFSSAPYLKDKETGQKLPAMDVFLSIWFHTRDWSRTPVILVAYGPLIDALGLPRGEKQYSLSEIQKNGALDKLCRSAMEKRHADRERDLSSLEQEAEIVQKRTETLSEINAGFESLNLIPHPSDASGTWISLAKLADSADAASVPKYYTKEQTEKVKAAFSELLKSYRMRDPGLFDTASQSLRSTLINLSPSVYPSHDALDREISYNKMRPFRSAWLLYLVATIAGALCFRVKNKFVYGGIFSVYMLGLAYHVYGFVLRCLIAGRPPVSNMYESVVWVGFGAVFFSMIFELIYRKRYFMLCGAIAGFLCLVLMDMLPVITGNSDVPGFGQEIKPLVPVLRNNFWLTVHVLTITLSYAAFMLTCVLGHVTLWQHLRNPGARDTHRELHQYVYRAMQVGVLLIACGTILGGVWAYYSWGRFWGWDPKETWAFITLLCYLVVLHGRFTGLWGNFGLSFGAVLCFNSVVMAWYGVNFVLGTGLHSYGFGAGGQSYVLSAVAIDLIFLAAATIRYVNYQAAVKQERGMKLTDADPIDEARALGAKDTVGAAK